MEKYLRGSDGVIKYYPGAYRDFLKKHHITKLLLYRLDLLVLYYARGLMDFDLEVKLRNNQCKLEAISSLKILNKLKFNQTFSDNELVSTIINVGGVVKKRLNQGLYKTRPEKIPILIRDIDLTISSILNHNLKISKINYF